MKIILNDVDPDDFILATRVARWMLEHFHKEDAILSYGEGGGDFYVRRNKSSITVRAINRKGE